MIVKKYRAKPCDIEAVQVTDDNMEDVANWCGGAFEKPYWIRVPTVHGYVPCAVGDWVAKGTHDFYPIDAEAFAERWEEVEASGSRESGQSR